MLRIALINVPFADWHRPSFALSQLAALTRREFGDQVQPEVIYVNQDFVNYFGVVDYTALAGNLEHLTTGIGDWLFRPVAFPHAPDNSAEYFRRYYQGAEWMEFKDRMTDRRSGIAEMCENLIEKYDLGSADIVGFTSMFAQNVAAFALARLIKERNPSTVTVIGGANCEPPMGVQISRQVPTLDFVFAGPALHTFVDLVGSLLAGRPEDAHAIPGVLSRRNNTDPRYTSAIGRERDIDDFFPPDYTDFIAALDRSTELSAAIEAGTKPILFFETSRGCWWGERSHCTFCGLNGLTLKYRAMHPTNARRQLEWLFGHAPWCTTYACTDNIMPKNYPREVFAQLEPPLGATLFYEVKLPVSEKDLRLMARAGVNRVQPGIESLSTETLSLMGKGTSSFQNIQFLKSCARFGIEPVWNLLVGFPGEVQSVYEKYQEDLPLLAHLPPPSGAYLVRFDRFSPYFTRADEYGLNLRPMDHYELVYPFPAESLANLAYFFTDDTIAPYALSAGEWLAPLNELIGEWSERWPQRPTLALEGNLVRDSRFGRERTLELDETSVAILRRLASPVTPARLASDLGLDPDDTLISLGMLREHALLFEENDRALSLVITPDDSVAERRDLPLLHPSEVGTASRL